LTERAQPDRDLLARACETSFRYLALGNEVFTAHGATFIRNRATPRRHDANTVGLVRSDPSELDALLAAVDAEYAEFGHRRFQIDALTPPALEARLALEGGYRLDAVLWLLLGGELRASPRPVEVREVVTAADWLAYRELDAMWWEESGLEYFGPYDPSLHDQLLLNKRLKEPQVRSWLACVEGVPRAFFSSWPGVDGLGMIEDLFCHPDYRRRGLATALIDHCVADARARGAGPILIGADPLDTPRQIYAALGFRPLFIGRGYLRRLG
jgi:GNAT superfamily N-acetyltransferase